MSLEKTTPMRLKKRQLHNIGHISNICAVINNIKFNNIKKTVLFYCFKYLGS